MIDYHGLNRARPKEVMQNAWTVAEEKLGIYSILDADGAVPPPFPRALLPFSFFSRIIYWVPFASFHAYPIIPSVACWSARRILAGPF